MAETSSESAKAPEGGAADSSLPPRQETILARYPRNLKIGAVAGIVGVLILLLLMIPSGSEHKKGHVEVSVATSVSGVDKKSAIANPEIAPVEKPQVVEDDGFAAAAADAAVATEPNTLVMTPAPAPGLTEDTAHGSLPRVSEDGRQPWQVYARPYDGSDKRPRIAIVITDLGLSRVSSDAAIDRLPPNVTLAFDAQSPVVGAWCARARQAGHETLLMLPMEPFDYPRSDPGPNTLLSNLTNAENNQRLEWALSQAAGYVGVTTLSGSHFTTDPERIVPVLEVLRKRGLMVFDARVAPHSAIADLARDGHVPVAVDTVQLDQNLSPAALDEALTRLEQSARLTGRAIAMTPSLPIVLDRLAPWIKQLPKDGIALAPLSAMVK